MSSVVGGWAVPYVGIFSRPVGDDLFFTFSNTGLPKGVQKKLIHSYVLFSRPPRGGGVRRPLPPPITPQNFQCNQPHYKSYITTIIDEPRC